MYSNGPHNGLDIAAVYGTPIVAAQAGEVIQAQYHWSWGNTVLIWHNETFSHQVRPLQLFGSQPWAVCGAGTNCGLCGKYRVFLWQPPAF